MQASTPIMLAALHGHQFANLTTFRRTGAEVTTPVWFALEGERVYVMTMMTAGKVKRLRNNSAARLAASDRAGKPLGPAVGVTGRILTGAEREAARAALGRKYGLQKKLFDLMFKLRGRQDQQAYLEFRIEP